ncbi:MAG: 50S ribosomal protein L25 [Actinomycetota bacterium]
MEVTLKATRRTELGKGPAHRSREAGEVPAVLYGSSVEPVALAVDAKQMRAALRTEAGANVLINLQLDSDSYLTIPREIHKHPIKGTFVHVDFINVARDVTINAEVPIHLTGESHGVKEGGQIDQHMHEIRIEALPTDVPGAIEVDLTPLGIGESIKVSDLNTPAGVTVLNDPEDVVVGVIEPTVMEVEAAEEELPEGEVEAAEEGESTDEPGEQAKE